MGPEGTEKGLQSARIRGSSEKSLQHAAWFGKATYPCMHFLTARQERGLGVRILEVQIDAQGLVDNDAVVQ